MGKNSLILLLGLLSSLIQSNAEEVTDDSLMSNLDCMSSMLMDLRACCFCKRDSAGSFSSRIRANGVGAGLNWVLLLDLILVVDTDLFNGSILNGCC